MKETTASFTHVSAVISWQNNVFHLHMQNFEICNLLTYIKYLLQLFKRIAFSESTKINIFKLLITKYIDTCINIKLLKTTTYRFIVAFKKYKLINFKHASKITTTFYSSFFRYISLNNIY